MSSNSITHTTRASASLLLSINLLDFIIPWLSWNLSRFQCNFLINEVFDIFTSIHRANEWKERQEEGRKRVNKLRGKVRSIIILVTLSLLSPPKVSFSLLCFHCWLAYLEFSFSCQLPFDVVQGWLAIWGNECITTKLFYGLQIAIPCSGESTEEINLVKRPRVG